LIKVVLTYFLRKTKRQSFCFDENVTSTDLFVFFYKKIIELVRYNLHRIMVLQKTGMAFVSSGVVIDNYRSLTIGKNSRIENYCVIGTLGKNSLVIGHNSTIGVFSRVVVSSGYQNLGEYIFIGNNVGVGGYSNIGGSGGVKIGDNTIIGPYFSAHPENHNFDYIDIPIRLQGTTRKPINIEENCWLGAKVTVLAGVTIGKGSIIGAGAVVTKDIPANSIALGAPAVVVKKRF
jgi:acetyltransferase-like isoleucine patch superfamily enzyme